MKNWLEMVTCPEQDFEELRSELAATRRRGGYLRFSDIRMPEYCGGAICEIAFMPLGSEAIALFISPTPRYVGDNPQIAAWCTRGSVTFADFDEMKAFIRRFAEPVSGSLPHLRRPSGSQPRRTEEEAFHSERGPDANCGLPRPERPVMEVDRTRLDPDAPAAQTLPDYVRIPAGELESALHEKIIGQDEAVKKTAHLVSVQLGTRNPKRPLSVFLWGPTGTGKSQLGKTLPDALNRLTGGKYDFHLEVVDCAQMRERHTIAKLTGSPPGYVGHGEPCIWDCTVDHPRTIFLFNELEKADPYVMQALMEAVDTGRQESSRVLDNGTRLYDLSKSMFFFTSNLDLSRRTECYGIGFSAADDPSPAQTAGSDGPEAANIMDRIRQDNDRDREVLNAKVLYPREVVARFTAFVQYRSFTNEEIMDMVICKISEAAYEQHALLLTGCDEEIIQELYEKCAPMVRTSGVRILERMVSNYLGETLMRFSHEHAANTRCRLTGTLYAPALEAEQDASQKTGCQPEYDDGTAR